MAATDPDDPEGWDDTEDPDVPEEVFGEEDETSRTEENGVMADGCRNVAETNFS